MADHDAEEVEQGGCTWSGILGWNHAPNDAGDRCAMCGADLRKSPEGLA